jgi:hypothetical protein
VIAAATVATAVVLMSPASTPSAGSVVYVARGGNDANAGTKASPVASFGRAYQLVRAGGIVEVGAGTYGYQRLARDRSKTSGKGVVFEPASSGVVRVSTLDFGQDQFGLAGPHHVTVRKMVIDYLRAWAGSADIRWLDIRGKHFDVFDARDVIVRGGDFGPCQAPGDDESCVSRIAGRANGVTVDGVSVHEVTSTDLANYHVDGMFIRGGKNIVIRNSKFWGNMITNIRIQDQECCTNSNLLIENNWFAPSLQGDGISTRFDAIDVDTDVPGLVVRNNSFAASGLQLTGSFSRARVVGNLLGKSDCTRGVTYTRNLFAAPSHSNRLRPCGITNRQVRGFGYVDAGRLDLRLRPDSPALAAGDPGDCAATDIERRPRLRGLKCDAGAYERQEAILCHRGRVGGRRTANTLLVALPKVRARIKAGDTMGRCGG